VEEEGLQPRKAWLGLFVFALWLGTAVVGFLEINTVLTMATRIYAQFWGDYGFYGSDYFTGTALRQLLVFPLAFLLIAAVIGGGEYHYRRLGQPRSWKLFGWVIAVELSILILVFYI
jgi:hypothetical protein